MMVTLATGAERRGGIPGSGHPTLESDPLLEAWPAGPAPPGGSKPFELRQVTRSFSPFHLAESQEVVHDSNKENCHGRSRQDPGAPRDGVDFD
jgi:hypothetical protein